MSFNVTCIAYNYVSHLGKRVNIKTITMGEHIIQECTCNVEFPFSFYLLFLVEWKLNWDFNS